MASSNSMGPFLEVLNCTIINNSPESITLIKIAITNRDGRSIFGKYYNNPIINSKRSYLVSIQGLLAITN